MTTEAKIGVIGGSGLYDIPGVTRVDEVCPDTPWGKPSDIISIMDIEGTLVAFLPRHGRGHSLLPTEVNSRANICALKMIGVEQILAFSAVGSLKEELKPLDYVIPTQVIDRTRNRPDSYFGDGVVGHVAFADPFCRRLGEVLLNQIHESKLPGGQTDETLVCMEGPLFSTRAESEWHRSMGAGLIGMTALPEAKFAREAELCYAVVSMVTDYDCWRAEDEDVEIQMVLQNLTTNAERARQFLKNVIPKLGAERDCGCPSACEYAIITAPENRPAATVAKLRTLLPNRL